MMTLEQFKKMLARIYGRGCVTGHSLTVDGNYIDYSHNEFEDVYAESVDVMIDEDEDAKLISAAIAQTEQARGEVVDIRLSAPAWPGQMQGMAPPAGWTHIGVPQPPIDLAAIREVIASIDLRAETYLDPQCKTWADKLARAIGDKP